MTDHTPDPGPATMARILALLTEVHAEVCGPARTERHLRAVGTEDQTRHAVADSGTGHDLADVIEIRRPR